MEELNNAQDLLGSDHLITEENHPGHGAGEGDTERYE